MVYLHAKDIQKVENAIKSDSYYQNRKEIKLPRMIKLERKIVLMQLND